MDLETLEQRKVKMIFRTAQQPQGGAPGAGPGPAASPFAGPMPGMGGAGGEGMMASPTGGPAPAAAAPAGAAPAQPTRPGGVHPESPAGDATTPKGREAEVRESLETFRNTILDLAQVVYEIPITEDQLKDIAERMIQTFSDRINEITIDRVIDIGHDLIGGYRSPYERRRRR